MGLASKEHLCLFNPHLSAVLLVFGEYFNLRDAESTFWDVLESSGKKEKG